MRPWHLFSQTRRAGFTVRCIKTPQGSLPDLLSPCPHRPAALPCRPAPERSAHCIPVGFLQPGCWSPAQSTLEPQSPQVMNQRFLSTSDECLCSYSFPLTVSTTHSRQVNGSHVPSQVPLSCEELTPGPTTSQGVVMTHPQSLEEYQPRLAASACCLGLLASGISMEAAGPHSVDGTTDEGEGGILFFF